MKLLAFSSLLFFLLAFQAAPIAYRADPAASQLTWTGYAEVGTWAPSGTVQLRRGTFAYDSHTVRNGRFEVDMSTIAHTESKLQEHLRSADFFDTQQFPTAVFVLREVRDGTADGQLTLKGVAMPLRFPVAVERLPDGRLRVHGTATIDRTRYGVNYNSSSFFQNLGSYAIRNDFQLKFDVVATPENGRE